MEKEYIEAEQAVRYLANKGIHRTKSTLIGWCKRHQLGHQTGGMRYGAWVIDVKKLDAYIAGKRSGG